MQVVSGTNHLTALSFELRLEVLPVVSILVIIVLIIQYAYDVQDREPPFGLCLVPNGSHLSVIEKSYRYLAHMLRLDRLVFSWTCTRFGAFGYISVLTCTRFSMFGYIFPLSFGEVFILDNLLQR